MNETLASTEGTGGTQAGLALPDPVALRAVAVESPTMRAALRIPMRMSITIPITALKLRDLRVLRVGAVFTTTVSAAEDVPVTVGTASLGWAELDNVDGQMAVRLTRLA